MGRALTTVAPEISIIPRGTNFVKCFFAQILDVENPVFCEYWLLQFAQGYGNI